MKNTRLFKKLSKANNIPIDCVTQGDPSSASVTGRSSQPYCTDDLQYNLPAGNKPQIRTTTFKPHSVLPKRQSAANFTYYTNKQSHHFQVDNRTSSMTPTPVSPRDANMSVDSSIHENPSGRRHRARQPQPSATTPTVHRDHQENGTLSVLPVDIKGNPALQETERKLSSITIETDAKGIQNHNNDTTPYSAPVANSKRKSTPLTTKLIVSNRASTPDKTPTPNRAISTPTTPKKPHPSVTVGTASKLVDTAVKHNAPTPHTDIQVQRQTQTQTQTLLMTPLSKNQRASKVKKKPTRNLHSFDVNDLNSTKNQSEANPSVMDSYSDLKKLKSATRAQVKHIFSSDTEKSTATPFTKEHFEQEHEHDQEDETLVIPKKINSGRKDDGLLRSLPPPNSSSLASASFSRNSSVQPQQQDQLDRNQSQAHASSSAVDSSPTKEKKKTKEKKMTTSRSVRSMKDMLAALPLVPANTPASPVDENSTPVSSASIRTVFGTTNTTTSSEQTQLAKSLRLRKSFILRQAKTHNADVDKSKILSETEILDLLQYNNTTTLPSTSGSKKALAAQTVADTAAALSINTSLGLDQNNSKPKRKKVQQQSTPKTATQTEKKTIGTPKTAVSPTRTSATPTPTKSTPIGTNSSMLAECVDKDVVDDELTFEFENIVEEYLESVDSIVMKAGFHAVLAKEQSLAQEHKHDKKIDQKQDHEHKQEQRPKQQVDQRQERQPEQQAEQQLEQEEKKKKKKAKKKEELKEQKQSERSDAGAPPRNNSEGYAVSRAPFDDLPDILNVEDHVEADSKLQNLPQSFPPLIESINEKQSQELDQESEKVKQFRFIAKKETVINIEREVGAYVILDSEEDSEDYPVYVLKRSNSLLGRLKNTTGSRPASGNLSHETSEIVRKSKLFPAKPGKIKPRTDAEPADFNFPEKNTPERHRLSSMIMRKPKPGKLNECSESSDTFPQQESLESSNNGEKVRALSPAHQSADIDSLRRLSDDEDFQFINLKNMLSQKSLSTPRGREHREPDAVVSPENLAQRLRGMWKKKLQTAGGELHLTRTHVAIHSVGFTENQNSKYRKAMEDKHKVIDSFRGKDSDAFFGIYDGHGGGLASNLIETHLHEVFSSELDKRIASEEFGASTETIRTALIQAYDQTDVILKEKRCMYQGATCVTCFLYKMEEKKYVLTANVGDARAVLCRNGVPRRLTVDHKSNNEDEIKRIEESGGFVTAGRVCGMLAVSRALGDHAFKKFVISTPHVSESEITAEDEFLVLACDGLWDVFNDNEVMELVRDRCGRGVDMQKVSSELVELALERGTKDNLSVMVIKL